MNTFFCSQESREAGEDPIGNAENYQVYVLVEYPPPWTRKAFNSKSIPANLQQLQQELENTNDSVVSLLIYNEEIKQVDSTKVIIYRQNDIANGYSKQEFDVADINDVAPAIKKCLDNTENTTISTTKDILICTHGSRDRCCAKYGNPFYREVKSIVNNLIFNNVRVWQVTHFGGHRFSPTAITFPDGRYYARLDAASFTSILTRSGDIKCINNIYRGWGILPETAQILEREMILIYGWEWFNYKVAYQLLEQSEDEIFNRIKISFTKPNGVIDIVRADVVIDESKSLSLVAYCDGEQLEKVTQYKLVNIII